MQHPERLFSTQNIYESVWNEPFAYGDNSTIMVHIRKLRTKIEDDPQNPAYIKNIWGKGYRYEPDAAKE
jgi:DNA-binding response OmpR family regulator